MESVLQVNESSLQLIEQEYAEIKGKLQDQHRRLEQLNRKRDSVKNEAYKGGGINYFLQREMFYAKIKSETYKVNEVIEELNLEAFNCEQRLKAARVKVKTHEKMRDKEFSSWQLDMNREEQYRMDEIGLQGYMKKLEGDN